MAHTSLCASAEGPMSACRCSCGGYLHGVDNDDEVIDDNGLTVKELLKELKDEQEVPA